MAFLVKTNSLSRLLRSATSKPYSTTQVLVTRRRFITSLLASDNESPSNNPGLRSKSPDEETKGFFMQQSMYRVKDPKVSLAFYSNVMGMSLLKRLDFPAAKFSLYFIGYEDTSLAPKDAAKRIEWTFNKRGTIELTHYWGTENDPKFQAYHSGNSEPIGFGHIGITVDDTYKACARFERLNIQFVKKPDEGNVKGVALIKDPDGYWIEIYDVKGVVNMVKEAAAADA